MKHVLSTLAVCLMAITAQAQTLYLSADAGGGFSHIESSYIGMNFDINSVTKFRITTGFSQNFGKGEYIGAGIGLERLFSVSFLPQGIEPVAMADLRGVFGQFEPEFPSNKASEGGIAYNLFVGLKYYPISVGASIAQYPLNNSRLFVNPLSVRLSW